MSELKGKFDALGYDLLSLNEINYVKAGIDPGTSDSCNNGSCDGGCSNGCSSCRPKCKDGGKTTI